MVPLWMLPIPLTGPLLAQAPLADAPAAADTSAPQTLNSTTPKTGTHLFDSSLLDSTLVGGVLPWLFFFLGLTILCIIAWKGLSLRERVRSLLGLESEADATLRIANRDAAEDAALASHALAADLRELSDGIAQRLDKQAARLEELIADAEQRIARLERLTHAERPVVIPPGSPAHNPSALAAFAYDGDDRVPTSLDIHESHVLAETSHHDHTIASGPAETISREIYRLADEGLPTVEIAQRLNQHTGKVELILALRNA